MKMNLQRRSCMGDAAPIAGCDSVTAILADSDMRQIFVVGNVTFYQMIAEWAMELKTSSKMY